MLLNKTGFFDSSGDPNMNGRYEILVQEVSKFSNDVQVKLAIRINQMDPYGHHRIWYRWSFYDYWNKCKANVNCLGLNTLDGSDDPFFYTTYQTLKDFYS